MDIETIRKQITEKGFASLTTGQKAFYRTGGQPVEPKTAITQTEEQRTKAFADAGVIDTNILTPTANLDFKTPDETPVTDVAGIGETATAALTPSQKQEEEMRQRLMEINELLEGEGELREKKEEEFGIPEQEQAMEDLGTRLRDLQRQAKAIPIQMQQMAEGRGITVGGLRPLQTGKLRENAIEALTVSSLIDASSGLLTSAQKKVDRAVEEKYGHLLREKETLIENLKILEDSPQASEEERQRAKAELEKQEEEKRLLEEQKANQKEIWAIAVETANAMAKSGTPIDTVLLDKIQNAPDKETALMLSRGSGVFIEPEKAPTGDIATFKQFFPDVDVTTPEGRQQFLNWKAQVSAAGRKPEAITITPEGKRSLIGAGFTSEEIDNIESDISTYGLDKALEGVEDEKQKEAIREIYGEKVEEEFLNREWLTKMFTDEQLKASAKEAGFTAGGFLGIGVGKQGINDYLDYLEGLIQQYRDAGFTDKEILKKMQ